MLSLDTHIIIAALARRLRTDEARVMEKHRWGISAIVLWELGHLSKEGRIGMRLDDRDFLRFLEDLEILPITLEVAKALRRLDFRSDPADEIIAATSIVHDIPLVTRDSRILVSKVVPFALS